MSYILVYSSEIKIHSFIHWHCHWFDKNEMLNCWGSFDYS